MKASVFAERYPSCFNRAIWEKFWNENAREKVMDFTVNFYLLLASVPLWRFNELYTEWYAKKDKSHEAGPMGDFMEDEPDEETIGKICAEITANGWDRNLN